MALFKREPADIRMRAEITTMHTRKADLASQLDETTASATAESDDLLAAHKKGDVSSATITKMEDRLALTERRISSLKSAIADIDRKITDAEAELAEHLASEAAEKAATALNHDHQVFTAKLSVFLDAAAELMPAAAKLGEHVFTAQELAGLARSMVPKSRPQLAGSKAKLPTRAI